MRTALPLCALTLLLTLPTRSATLEDFEPRQYKDPDGNTFVLHQLYQPRTRVLSFPPAGS